MGQIAAMDRRLVDHELRIFADGNADRILVEWMHSSGIITLEITQ